MPAYRDYCEGVRPMNDIVEAPLHRHPTINVRALLGPLGAGDEGARAGAAGLGFAGGGTDSPILSDTFGGCVLNATIGKFAYCSIAVRGDRKVRFAALDLELELETYGRWETGSAGVLALHKAVHRRIVGSSSATRACR